MSEIDRKFREVAAEQNTKAKNWFSLSAQKQYVFIISAELQLDNPEWSAQKCVSKAQQLVSQFREDIYIQDIRE